MKVCIVNISTSRFSSWLYTVILTISPCRCTLNPSDQVALEGPLSRVKSIKKSLRQSFRRIRRSRVSMHKHHTNNAAKVSFSAIFSFSCFSTPNIIWFIMTLLVTFIPVLLFITQYILVIILTNFIIPVCGIYKSVTGIKCTAGGRSSTRNGAGPSPEEDWSSLCWRLFHWPC